MPRILLLCGLCLFLPGLARGSNQLESVALAEMAPVPLGLLFFTLAILLAAPFVIRKEFRSSQRTPSLLYIATILFAVLIGLIISGISYQLDKQRESSFPNLLTEVYVPIALLFVCLKQLRQHNAAAVLWISSAAACLLIPTLGVAGLASLGESHPQAGPIIFLAELFLTLALWLVLFWRIKKRAADDVSQITMWLIPILGSGLAVLYRSFLFAARALLFSFESASFIDQRQGIRLLLYCASGFLAVAVIFLLPLIKLPIRQPEPDPHGRPGPQG